MAPNSEYIGTYKIIEKIGEGGMAFIYKAIQPSLKRTVVIKKLKDPNREIVKRFKKEALLSASFHHENLVAIYDFIYANRNYYLVMEHVDGEDLHSVIDYLTPIPAQTAALISLAIARGLEYTHSRNIIHRDIKPSNILISFDGDVKLIDFGIARDDLSTRLTLTGMIVGTPAYMSPEQANGDSLTAQSDIFSLGVLLYEMLTGLKPFNGANQSEVLNRIIRGNYVPVGRINPTIPLRLRRIVKKCLQHYPRKRYRSATELINDLERFLPWQVRSQRKRILARFLNQLNKTQPSNSQTTIPIFVDKFSNQRWRIFKSGIVLMTILATALLVNRLKFFHLGSVEILSSESAYQIYVDQNRGFLKSGSKILIPNLLQGRHRIKINDLKNNDAYSILLNVSSGKRSSIRLPKVIDYKLPVLKVYSEPGNAQLFIDGQRAGVTPFQTDSVSAGTHQVRIVKPGFEEMQTSIRCITGKEQRFLFVLEPLKPSAEN
ncbi:MAG: protein kinase [Calditrichaeota bacterium]|nr:protein kinase [Calditrichota bacterium]